MADEEKERKDQQVEVKDVEGDQTPIISWQSPEFVNYRKTSGWYVSVAAAAIILIALFIWMKVSSGALVVAAGAIVFLAFSGIRPKNISCAIYKDGIVIGDKTYSFDQFKSFWIVTSDIVKAKFEMVGRFAGEIILPLENVDVDQVRSFLKKKLPEAAEKGGEDFADFIRRKMRF